MSRPAPCDLLFVYGTLRRGTDSPMLTLLTAEAEALGEARIQGRLFKVDWYPGAVKSSNGSDQVIGELFRLKDPDIVLQQLDRYEGVGPEFPQPNEYLRSLESVRMKDGSHVKAWIYWFVRPCDGLERIESGDFLAPQG